MASYVLKQGAISQSILALLTDKNGPVDLPVGTSVTMVARIKGATTPKINAGASIIEPGAAIGNPNRGKVRYDPNATDLNTPGIYEVEWNVVLPTGPVPQTFPDDGYMIMLVLPNGTSV
jgi:hypothetical protein